MNSTISWNSSSGTRAGGGIYLADTTKTTTIANTKFSNNSTQKGGVKNSILWGNTAGNTGPQISGTPTVTYSYIEGTFAWTGNINSDPLFTSFTADDKATGTTSKITGDYHIQSSWPVRRPVTMPMHQRALI